MTLAPNYRKEEGSSLRLILLMIDRLAALRIHSLRLHLKMATFHHTGKPRCQYF